MSTLIPDSQSCQTLADWLCYIEHNHPIHQIELGLERVNTVAGRANLQQLPGRTVLIGGTNGKGTTARCLEQLLLAQGYSVGVYTSPHLLHFNERLRINGTDVDNEHWVAGFAFIEQLRADIALTYFEFTTLVAFYLLRQQPCDFCLIEVGLGGRLDATNIVAPDVSVITTVDLDHQDWLGDNREAIGFEKAGIFRAGKVAVIGELQAPASVLAQAQLLGCNTVLAQQHYQYQQHSTNWSWHGQHSQLDGLPYPAMPVQNAACALAVLEQLACLPAREQVSNVLATLTLAGRMQWLQQSPAIIIDVAHNPQSARYLAEQLQALKPRFSKLKALVGMLKDKDIAQTLAPLTSLFDQWHLVSLPGARGANVQHMVKYLPDTVSDITLHDEVLTAYGNVSATLKTDELLVVFGSFITVSAVLAGHQEAR
ncbi:bifunctional tetrahydrofolate synthase/dihydrofolate synthase [Rheinheimera sp.]|uniref:bifunctional tetrahydrofolate synthase/dihydrofolate synthase n=1 Tax=Rheinheimera sp. TaxID=1869214 RepID=UPI0040481DED